MDFPTPPAEPADLAAWLAELPPGVVLLDCRDYVWRVLIAAAHPFEQDAEPVTVLATIGNAMHWLQASASDMARIARRGIDRVLYWPEPAAVADADGQEPAVEPDAAADVAAEPSSNGPASDPEFDALLAASSVGTPAAVALRAQTPAHVSQMFADHLARRVPADAAADGEGAAGASMGGGPVE